MSGKKLTQTTLSFFIKSPIVGTSNPASSFTGKKRQLSSQESKCDASTLKNKKIADDGNISEPEVTSSSEPVTDTSTATTGSVSQQTLEAFVQLTRCDTPTSIEVSSSTSVDENADVPVEISVCDAVDTSAHSADDCNAADRDNNLHSDNEGTSENTPKMDTDGELVKPSTKNATKSMSLSAKKRREEQRVLMEERRKQREEEREKKRLEKLEEKRRKEKEAEEARRQKNEQKEAERLAKQQEKEAKQKAKEALQAQKQAEIDAKNALKLAEKQRKEEERSKKEEEKKQKEAERLREEERKQKALDAQRNVLMKFFQKPVKKEDEEEVQVVTVAHSRFKAFCPNSDMKLAPRSRVPPINTEEFDDAVFTDPLNEHQYFSELKAKGTRTSPSTWPWAGDDDDVTMVTASERRRVKLLQFHTDVRPAYFGTWKKKSTFISARRPFGEDRQRFDYDNDSADEWEEEEPGESVDSDDEEEEKDEFDFDPELREDGFLVDHNYLSDGEGGVSDNEETLAAKKTKQMIARTYGKRNRKKNKLKTVIYGTVWQDEQVAGQEEHHVHMLNQFSAIMFENVPIEFNAPIQESPNIADANSSAKKSLHSVPEEALPQLIKSIHGCVKGMKVIIGAVQNLWKAETSVLLSKKALKTSIQSMACYEKRATYKKSCWFVKDEFLTKYGLLDLPIPNPAYKVKTPRKSGSLTPAPKSSPSVISLPGGASNGQKRLTDFVQPAKKKLKVESGGTPTSGCSTPTPLHVTLKSTTEKSAKRVELVTLSDSPVKGASSATVKNVAEISSPKSVSLTTLPTAPKTGTPTCKTSIQPRRVALTTVMSTPTSQAVSPRRIQLITLCTPPKSGGATGTRVVTPTAGGETEKCATPTSSSQINRRSPRRVQLTTLSRPQTACQPVVLLERSQNTPKLEENCVIMKATTK